MTATARRASQDMMPPAPSSPPFIAGLWRAYRTDGDAVCARCEARGAFAIAVSYAPRGYQLQCARCGWGTPWFDCHDGEIALLGLDRFGRRMDGSGPR